MTPRTADLFPGLVPSSRDHAGDSQFWIGTKADALPLLSEFHYRGDRVSDPMHVFMRGIPPEACAVFASPVNKYFGRGAVELIRLVRSEAPQGPLSQFVARAVRWLRRETKLQFLISYADSGQGHHGGIYQALSFDFVRVSDGHANWRGPDGTLCSSRAFDQRSPENRVGWVRESGSPKFLYVKALNESRKSLMGRFGWEPLPYPKPDLLTAGKIEKGANP